MNNGFVRFAFDLGTNSIGWAVYLLSGDPQKSSVHVVELIGSGVRTFDDGRNPKDGRSLAEMRRGPRSARKRRDRFVLRRTTLLHSLIRYGLLPSVQSERTALAFLDPYKLRAEALDRSLEPYEIGRLLMHINQRRGLKSNRRADRKSKNNDGGTIATAVAQPDAKLKDAGARTFGEFLWTRHRGEDGLSKPRSRLAVRIRLSGEGASALYDYYPSREMLTNEFDVITAAQAAHHPAILTADAVGDLRETIFHQRPLKPAEVGFCTFVKGERRLPKALPSVEARTIYETLNALRFGSGLTLSDALSVEHCNLLASTLMRGENITFSKLRRIIGIGADVRISLEEAGKSDLKDYAARSAALAYRKLKGSERETLFGERWFSMPLEERDSIVQKLIDTDDEQEIVDCLKREHKLDEIAARSVAAWTPRDGHARLGRTANDKILIELMSDDRPVYSEAAKRAGWHHSDERDGIIELPLPYYGQVLERHVLFGSGDPEHAHEKRYGRFPNPTAHIALNQLRKVVNHLVKAYGEPAQIVIELARDLKRSKDEKDKAQRKIRENTAIRERHRQILADNRQLERPDNFLRLRLFEEQQRAGDGIARCPFSLDEIKISQLFSAEIEIEHVLPYSRTLDDSAANKVVCFRKLNRMKRGKTPFEAFGDKPKWPDVSTSALRLPHNKRWRFAADAMERYTSTERDFLTRQLGETRHLSKMARAYLSKACHPDHVYVTTGQLTAMLRGRWGLNGLFRDHNRESADAAEAEGEKKAKARDDHRHHAVDACVIGAIDRSLLQEMAQRAGQAEIEDRERITADVPEPLPNFRDTVKSQIDKIIVSVKPEIGKGGALHEETAYGLVKNAAEAAQIGNLVVRKLLVDLTPGEIDRIRDSRLREDVQAATTAVRNDAKALAATLAKFAAEKDDKRGRAQGIRRVRIGKAKTGEVHIKDRRNGAVYKALIPGENHHVDIVQMRDGSWRGFAATVFEVNQKGWRPRWEVDKLGGKLVMRLHKGDTIEVDDGSGGRIVKVVHRLEIGNNRVRLAAHNEGGSLQKRHDDDQDLFRWDFANIGALKTRNARKVSVNAVGKSSYVKTNCAEN